MTCHRGPRPVPVAHEGEDGFQAVQVGDGRWHAHVAAVVQPVGGLHALVDGGERGAVAVADGQGNLGLVAGLPGVGAVQAVVLAGVAGEVEVGPVMHDRGVALASRHDRAAGAVQQGLGQGGEGDAGVAPEAPGGLGGGEGLSGGRQGARAGRRGLGLATVPLDQFVVTRWQGLAQSGWRRDHPNDLRRTAFGSCAPCRKKEKCCRYQWSPDRATTVRTVPQLWVPGGEDVMGPQAADDAGLAQQLTQAAGRSHGRVPPAVDPTGPARRGHRPPTGPEGRTPPAGGSAGPSSRPPRWERHDPTP
jgi:hypothetical protein